MSIVRNIRGNLRLSETSSMVILGILIILLTGILLIKNKSPVTDLEIKDIKDYSQLDQRETEMGDTQDIYEESQNEDNTTTLFIDHQNTNKKDKESKQAAHTSNIKSYDVMLTSYMRSGSTLTGNVLGWRLDSFYLYEPLWKVARWAYYSGNDTICRSDRPDCFQISPSDAPDKKFVNNKDNFEGHSLNDAIDILKRFYDCDFTDFDKLVIYDALTAKLGGYSWNSYKDCRKFKPVSQCVEIARRECKKSKHRVSKVLRLTLDNVEQFLEQRPNLKVIHLFRDPRAIINSRLETKWFPASNRQSINNNADILCKKMLYDYKVGVKLQEKFKGRFRFVFYEDLNTLDLNNPMKKVRTLYRYLGMSLDERKFTSIKNLPVFNVQPNEMKSERVRNTAFWWRKSLNWDIVKGIDSICKDVYSALGYKKFNNVIDLQDLTKPSLVIQEEHLIA